MTLEAFYFITQILAALAVVGSLLFVGLQVRAQTAEQRQIRIQDRNASLYRYLEMVNGDPATRRALIGGLASFSSLAPEDRILFNNLMTTISRTTLIYERQLLDKDITQESFDQYIEYMTPYWGAPGFKEIYENRGHLTFGSADRFVRPIVDSPEGLAAYEAWRAVMVGERA